MTTSIEFLNERIAKLKARIIQYEDLIADFVENGAILTYTLDDGQTRTVSTRMDTVRMEQEVARMMSRLDNLCNRLAAEQGGGSPVGVPCW